jgi:hypothetical protein
MATDEHGIRPSKTWLFFIRVYPCLSVARSCDRIMLVMNARAGTVVSVRRKATCCVDQVYRRARKTAIATEDQAINALCDARLKERRHPLQELLDQLGHELER